MVEFLVGVFFFLSVLTLGIILGVRYIRTTEPQDWDPNDPLHQKRAYRGCHCHFCQAHRRRAELESYMPDERAKK